MFGTQQQQQAQQQQRQPATPALQDIVLAEEVVASGILNDPAGKSAVTIAPFSFAQLTQCISFTYSGGRVVEPHAC